MKISINLAEDAELRRAVKEMVKQAVVSTAREEVKTLVEQVAAQKLATLLTAKDAERSLEQAVSRVISQYTKADVVRGLIKDKIAELVQEQFRKAGVLG